MPERVFDLAKRLLESSSVSEAAELVYASKVGDPAVPVDDALLTDYGRRLYAAAHEELTTGEAHAFYERDHTSPETFPTLCEQRGAVFVSVQIFRIGGEDERMIHVLRQDECDQFGVYVKLSGLMLTIGVHYWGSEEEAAEVMKVWM